MEPIKMFCDFFSLILLHFSMKGSETDTGPKTKKPIEETSTRLQYLSTLCV